MDYVNVKGTTIETKKLSVIAYSIGATIAAMVLVVVGKALHQWLSAPDAALLTVALFLMNMAGVEAVHLYISREERDD